MRKAFGSTIKKFTALFQAFTKYVFKSLKIGYREINPNHCQLLQTTMNAGQWTLMHDQLTDGFSLRLLNVIDDSNREALAIEWIFYYRSDE